MESNKLLGVGGGGWGQASSSGPHGGLQLIHESLRQQ